MNRLQRALVFVILAFTPALLYVACGSDKPTAAKQPEPPKPEQQITTTTTTVPSWPGMQIHTITKTNVVDSDDNKTPNAIDYWWHGTLDGHECILVEDSANVALSCNWNNQ